MKHLLGNPFLCMQFLLLSVPATAKIKILLFSNSSCAHPTGEILKNTVLFKVFVCININTDINISDLSQTSNSASNENVMETMMSKGFQGHLQQHKIEKKILEENSLRSFSHFIIFLGITAYHMYVFIRTSSTWPIAYSARELVTVRSNCYSLVTGICCMQGVKDSLLYVCMIKLKSLICIDLCVSSQSNIT